MARAATASAPGASSEPRHGRESKAAHLSANARCNPANAKKFLSTTGETLSATDRKQAQCRPLCPRHSALAQYSPGENAASISEA